MQEGYGTAPSSFVCVLFFVITIGLFNVIAAIFVESTMQAAYSLQILRKVERMNDPLLWSAKLSIIITKLFEHNGTEISGNIAADLRDLSIVPVEEEQFRIFIQDEEVVKALDELEIDAADHKYLFDILDNDNTGSILVTQLVDGLQRLRGDPRRSDIITVDLMIRSIQDQTNYLVEAVGTVLDRVTSLLEGGALQRQNSSASINQWS